MECGELGMLNGKDGFLVNADINRARKRLSIISVYEDHLTEEARAHDEGKYAVRNCTGRQKRLVSYYKVFRYIFGKGTHGVRRKLPACVCNVVQRWYPDDKHDEEYQARSRPARSSTTSTTLSTGGTKNRHCRHR